MFTALVLLFIAVMWWRAQSRYQRSTHYSARRSRSGWSWAFVGAAVGSCFGIAGLGSAIAGTLPGAAVGYLLADYLMLRQGVDEPAPRPQQINAPSIVEAKIQSTTQSGAPYGPRAIKLFLLLGVFGVILFVVFTSGDGEGKASKDFGAESNKPTPVPQSPSTKTPPTQSTPAQITPARSSYDQMLLDLEGRNPQINPNSSDFDARVAEAVQARIVQLKGRGVSPETALAQAVKEVLSRRNGATSNGSTVSQPDRKSDRLPNCQYKSVMSDDDYRACGLRPPEVR